MFPLSWPSLPFDPTQFSVVTISVFALLGVMSVAAVTVFFAKLLQFARLGVGRRREAERILDLWLSGDGSRAAAMAERRRSVQSRILHAVFTGMEARPDDAGYAEELGWQTARIELSTMSRWTRFLDMVVQAAPMLGLLGTVIGMIDSFAALAAQGGEVDPTALAGGIWTALTTTALGLAIALAAFVVVTFFEGRIERERSSIEALISGAVHGRVGATAPARR